MALLMRWLTRVSPLILVFTAGCVTVSERTRALSLENLRLTKQSETLGFGVIDKWIKEREERLEENLELVFEPQWLKNWLAGEGVQKVIRKKVCQSQADDNQALAIQKIVRIVSKRFEKERRKRYRNLRKSARKVRMTFREFYALTGYVSGALHSNISAAVKTENLKDALREKAGIPDILGVMETASDELDSSFTKVKEEIIK